MQILHTNCQIWEEQSQSVAQEAANTREQTNQCVSTFVGQTRMLALVCLSVIDQKPKKLPSVCSTSQIPNRESEIKYLAHFISK